MFGFGRLGIGQRHEGSRVCELIAINEIINKISLKLRLTEKVSRVVTLLGLYECGASSCACIWDV